MISGEWWNLLKVIGIASTGLYFGKDPYDVERYEQVAAIANGMLALLADTPVSRIESLVSDFAQGYATPKVDVRGAVLRNDKILLVKESRDGLWTLPGGFADIGLSPRENVVKEVWEEANLRVDADRLYGIRHKAKHDYDEDARDFYKLFFVCEGLDQSEPTASGLETTDVGFFSRDRLPELSLARVIPEDIYGAFEFAAKSDQLAFCD